MFHENLNIDTILAQAGSRRDPHTGAISTPIHQCATFRHPALGESTGFDYSRTANPTRQALETAMAELEGGRKRTCLLLRNGGGG
ncbi:MAG: PLP-dependent transferase [Geovibrio sp.]|nr:PLP-dependent transferase [Geovibrio sp.]